MNFSAILFDMDGLLVDNHAMWDDAHRHFFRVRGIAEDDIDVVRAMCMGKSMEEGSAILKEHFSLPESVEEIITERLSVTDKIYSELAPPMPGATSLLSFLHEKGIPMAVASGSSTRRIEMIVDRFGWRSYFLALASADDVDYVGKPAPDIFLYAAQQLGVPPQSCVVFEDAPYGVDAAHAAGMQVIAIPNTDMIDHPTFDRAHLKAASLSDPQILSFLGM